MEKLEENSILDYLSKMPFEYRDNLNVPEDMNFGTEIEFMVKQRNNVEREFRKFMLNQAGKKKYFKLTNDPRVVKSNTGMKIIELKTPVLKNTKEDFCILRNIINDMTSDEIVPSNQKGIHVHADMSQLENNPEHLETLLKLLCLYEHIINRFSYGEEDRTNINLANYSRQISNKLYKYLKRNGKLEDFDKSIKELREIFNLKTYAINFHQKDFNCKTDTIEIRQFNSSFNPVIIQNDINLVLSMIHNTINNNVDKELLDYKFDEYDNKLYSSKSSFDLNLSDAIEFSDLVFNKQEDQDYFLRQYAIKPHSKEKKLVI